MCVHVREREREKIEREREIREKERKKEKEKERGRKNYALHSQREGKRKRIIKDTLTEKKQSVSHNQIPK